MPEYAAFLRGINVGGHHRVPMQDLARCLESLGFDRIRTFLASGNVLFSTPRTAPATLEKAIRDLVLNRFGHDINVLVRTLKELQGLIELEPLTSTRVSPASRLYVTFLPRQAGGGKKTPVAAAGGAYRFVRVTDREVITLINPTAAFTTVDLMAILDRTFGKEITTRDWKTILRMVNAAHG